MCPMRFVLVFFSLLVAAYIACKAFWMSDAADSTIFTQQIDGEGVKGRDNAWKRGYAKVISGLWMLLDMASGRYLWRTISSQPNQVQSTAS